MAVRQVTDVETYIYFIMSMQSQEAGGCWQVTDIEPDQKVRTAMNEINAAQRMRMAAKEKAEADRVMVVTRAQGDAEAKYLEVRDLPRLCVCVYGRRGA